MSKTISTVDGINNNLRWKPFSFLVSFRSCHGSLVINVVHYCSITNIFILILFESLVFLSLFSSLIVILFYLLINFVVLPTFRLEEVIVLV